VIQIEVSPKRYLREFLDMERWCAPRFSHRESKELSLLQYFFLFKYLLSNGFIWWHVELSAIAGTALD
jgi:hypothetical protein